MKIRLDENNKEIITITKNDLVSVALLYNFLANNSTVLLNHKIDNFQYHIMHDGYLLGDHYNKPKNIFEFVEEEQNPVTLEYFLLVQSLNKMYSETEALNIDYLLDYYKYLPIEIKNATLSKEALSTIGVNREDLTIDSIVENYPNSIDIYAMSEKNAIEKATNYLEGGGFKNINLGSTLYEEMETGNHLFMINYNADRFLDTIDINKAKMKVLGKFRKDI